MASLNTLRTKGGVIVSIVIGLALLAFLLGDMFSSGSTMLNSRKMRVGEIDGNKIGYEEYSENIDRYTQISQSMSGQSLDSEGQEMVREMAWESLINEYAYQPGFEKLGIMPLGEEQKDMVAGVYKSPVIESAFTSQQTNMFDPTALRNFVARAEADASGATMMVWRYMKEQMNNQRVMSKYMALVSKGIFVNDLEVEAGVHQANNVYSARVVSKEYIDVADSLVAVTPAEITAYYNAHKSMMKQEASREVEYVMFDLLPSEQDHIDAAKYIAELSEEFNTAESPMQYATLNSQEKPDTRYLSRTQLDPAIAAVVFDNAEAIYGPELKNDVYTVARQANIRMVPDSVGVRRIVLPMNERSLVDSIVNVVNNGSNFELLAAEFSIDQQTSFRGGDMGVFDPTALPAEMGEPLFDARVNDVMTVNSAGYTYIMQLTYKSGLSRKAQIATLTYKVEPSSTTQNALYGEVSKFYTNAAGSYDNFNKAANEAAMPKGVARIGSTDREVQGVNESLELVRWAYNSEKGNVSNIMDLGGDYIVAALVDIKEDGTPSEQAMSSQIRTILMKQKKAEAIEAEIKGMTFDQIAAKFDAEPTSVEDVTFEKFYVEGAGTEQKVIGAITAGLAQGSVSKPVRGDNGVFVFEAAGQAFVAEEATKESEKVKLEAMGGFYLGERLQQALLEACKIKDTRVKFF